MGWVDWIVIAVCLLVIVLSSVCLRQLRKREATRRAILDLLRPWLVKELGRGGARRLSRSLGNLLDPLPEEQLRDLLLSCGGLEGPAMLDRIEGAISEWYAPLAAFGGDHDR